MNNINAPENDRGTMKIRPLIYGSLVIFIAIQIMVIWTSYVSWWGVKIWDVRDQPVWERAGRLPLWFGDDFTDLVVFLHNTLPEESSLLVPSSGWIKSNTPILQFMLHPRMVVSCEGSTKECTEQALSSGWWILNYNNFPPDEAMDKDLELLPYLDELGVYIPLSKEGPSGVVP